ncbi:DUF1127 domain-containing protein [Phaeobacter sp.]|uniref:DUF1127 domain-containing protein n=1 Tax=Phaeobacter sp. TaxID=1902409 RepID=UPI0025D5D34B|nr:DUF1127 domain-containing protein [Phaeobacter sp.]
MTYMDTPYLTSYRHSRTWLGTLLHCMTIWQERQALARMEAHDLEDLGLSAKDAAAEAGRSFWDLPSNR